MRGHDSAAQSSGGFHPGGLGGWGGTSEFRPKISLILDQGPALRLVAVNTVFTRARRLKLVEEGQSDFAHVLQLSLLVQVFHLLQVVREW